MTCRTDCQMSDVLWYDFTSLRLGLELGLGLSLGLVLGPRFLVLPDHRAN